MNATPELTPVLDVAGLPDAAMGPRGLIWWGTFGFMLIEGAGFVLAGGSLLYLWAQAPRWPPAGVSPPTLIFGLAFTALILLSAIPNLWLEKRARLRPGRFKMGSRRHVADRRGADGVARL